MPGPLHEMAVKKAIALLGHGSKTKGFAKAFVDAMVHEETGGCGGDVTACDYCSELDEPFDCIQSNTEFWKETFHREVGLQPDAYKITYPYDSEDGLGLIDIIEIDGTSTLRMKLDRYQNLAWIIDTSDHNCILD